MRTRVILIVLLIALFAGGCSSGGSGRLDSLPTSGSSSTAPAEPTDIAAFVAKYSPRVTVSCIRSPSCYADYSVTLGDIRNDLGALPAEDVANFTPRLRDYAQTYGKYLVLGCPTDDTNIKCDLYATTGMSSTISFVQNWIREHS